MSLSMLEASDAKPTPLPSLDPTQHSAAMLCDLQCRSSQSGSVSRQQWAKPTSASSSPSSTFPASWWTSLFLRLIHLHIQTCYKQTLLALWTISPSRMQGSIRASTTRLATISCLTTSSTRTPSLLRSTQPLAQPRAATGRVTQKGALAALTRHSALMRYRGTGDAVTRRTGQDRTPADEHSRQSANVDGHAKDDGVRR